MLKYMMKGYVDEDLPTGQNLDLQPAVYVSKGVTI